MTVARAGRVVFGTLLAGALGCAAYLAWVSSFGSPPPVEVLPAGALGVVEARDAQGLAGKLAGTRFAAEFSRSAGREWLERTETARAFDAALDEIKGISGVSLGRGAAFDLVGAEAAAGWYPSSGGSAAGAPWVAGGRLSARAWAVAVVASLGRRFGLGAGNVTSEVIAGRVLYSFPGSDGQSLHLFLAGRVLVVSPDHALAAHAARASRDAGVGVTREPAWQAIRGALPAQGEIYAWVRDQGTIPGAAPAGRTRGSAGARLRAGRTIEIDAVSEPVAARPAAKPVGDPSAPPPGLGLLRQTPLFLLTSRAPVPPALADLLQSRRGSVARRSAASTAAAIRTGSGYAIVVTGSAEGSGFFPVPQGVVVIGMADAAEAARALPLLYPPGARTASGGGARALATRESFPLAGEFELWGAATGPHLVFATDLPLVDAAVAGAGAPAARRPEDRSWPVDTVATISIDQVLPLLKRWGAPLSGLVAANWPQAPDITRDLGLLSAIGSMRVAAGSDDRFDRAAVTLDVHDLR